MTRSQMAELRSFFQAPKLSLIWDPNQDLCKRELGSRAEIGKLPSMVCLHLFALFCECCRRKFQVFFGERSETSSCHFQVRLSAVHSATELPAFCFGSGWSAVLRPFPPFKNMDSVQLCPLGEDQIEIHCVCLVLCSDSFSEAFHQSPDNSGVLYQCH